MKHQPDAHGRAVLIGKDGLQKQRVVIARVAVAAEHGVSQAVDHRYAVYQLVALHHMGVVPHHEVRAHVHGVGRHGFLLGGGLALIFGARMHAVYDQLAAHLAQGVHLRAQVFLRAGGQAERRTREADHHAVMRPHRYMVRVKIGHACVLQRGLGIGVAFRTIVQGVVVAQSRQFHPAQRQNGGKIRRSFKIKGLFHPIQRAVGQNALQIHHGDVVAVQQGLEIEEGIVVSLAQRGLHKAAAAVGRLAFSAQRAVAQKAQRHLTGEAADLHGRIQQRFGRVVRLKHIPLRTGPTQRQGGAGRQTGGGISNPHRLAVLL